MRGGGAGPSCSFSHAALRFEGALSMSRQDQVKIALMFAESGG